MLRILFAKQLSIRRGWRLTLYGMSKKQNMLVLTTFASLLIAALVIVKNDSKPIENEIYLSLFGGDLLRIEDNTGILVVSSPSTCELSESDAQNFPSDLKRQFLSANDTSSFPIRLNSLEGLVDLVSWEDTKRLYKSRIDSSIPARIEHHVIYALSRVGLNTAKTEGMLCVVTLGDHVKAQAIHMKKQKDQWRIQNVEVLWLS